MALGNHAMHAQSKALSFICLQICRVIFYVRTQANFMRKKYRKNVCNQCRALT